MLFQLKRTAFVAIYLKRHQIQNEPFAFNLVKIMVKIWIDGRRPPWSKEKEKGYT